MKRSLTLTELLIVLMLLGLAVPLVANKLTSWKRLYAFSQDHKTIEQLLSKAQLFSILASQSAKVYFRKNQAKNWTVSIDYGDKHDCLKSLETLIELPSIDKISQEQDQHVFITFYPPFGNPSVSTFSIVQRPSSSTTVPEERLCGKNLMPTLCVDHTAIFSDDLLCALEKSS